MGYAATMIVIYGVKLNPQESTILNNYLEENNLWIEGDLNIGVEDITSIPPIENAPPYINNIQTPMFHHPPRERYNTPREVHFVNLCSHGTDSRIHDNGYEEGYDHSFGIYCGSDGYAYGDMVSGIIADIPEEAIDNFSRHCYPILEQLNLPSDPSVSLVQQTW
tara:strand:- start:87660 stop:88151 length:492 start_codon:yes stop_codon:yes gene_type:complete